MNSDIKLKFTDGDFSMDVTYSKEDKTIWMNMTEIANLFEKDKSIISRRLKSIVESVVSPVAKYDTLVAKRATTGADGKSYNATCYSLPIILRLGGLLNSDRGEKLKAFLDGYLGKLETNISNNIIIYNNGSINLAVNISPEEETVWLNQNQIAELFETTQQNVNLHIKNIIEENELMLERTHKYFLYTASDGKRYSVEFFNLDMILAVGYRVKSKRAIDFRRWVSSVLKPYLLKGYVVDDNRTLVTNENYINLVNRVDNIEKRVKNIEGEYVKDNQKLFFDGEFFDSRTFIKKLISRAQESIILIDPYADVSALDYLTIKKNDVEAYLYKSEYAKLTDDDVNSFNEQYGRLHVYLNDTFHCRFLILDKKEIYHIGTSLNYAGNKTFATIKMNDENFFIESILKKLQTD